MTVYARNERVKTPPRLYPITLHQTQAHLAVESNLYTRASWAMGNLLSLVSWKSLGIIVLVSAP